VVIPDIGGIAGVAHVGKRQAGLRFACWDSRDLAARLQTLIENQALHAEFTAAAPHVAAHFSIEKLGERILDHLGLPHWQGAAETAPLVSSPAKFRAA
jgi:hypothetical protein